MEKREIYRQLLTQVESLIEGETNRISVLANVTAAVKEALAFFWVGFYLVENDELALGPFQGSVACYHIGYGKGVCGTAWARRQTVVVEDVEAFPGHIACSSLSRSEIVVPLFDGNGEVAGVLVMRLENSSNSFSFSKLSFSSFSIYKITIKSEFNLRYMPKLLKGLAVMNLYLLGIG